MATNPRLHIVEYAYAPFVVSDDGVPENLFGVWRETGKVDPIDGKKFYRLVGSGMKEKNARAVAEALFRAKANGPGSILNESLE